jgi:hypothetical protein
MFQGVTWPCEIIFCLLTGAKSDFVEVEKAMFRGFGVYWNLIFCLLNVPKSDLGEVKKAMFQGVAWHRYYIFCLLAGQIVTWGGGKTMFQWVARP